MMSSFGEPSHMTASQCQLPVQQSITNPAFLPTLPPDTRPLTRHTLREVNLPLYIPTTAGIHFFQSIICFEAAANMIDQAVVDRLSIPTDKLKRPLRVVGLSGPLVTHVTKPLRVFAKPNHCQSLTCMTHRCHCERLVCLVHPMIEPVDFPVILGRPWVNLHAPIFHTRGDGIKIFFYSEYCRLHCTPLSTYVLKGPFALASKLDHEPSPDPTHAFDIEFVHPNTQAATATEDSTGTESATEMEPAAATETEPAAATETELATATETEPATAMETEPATATEMEDAPFELESDCIFPFPT